MDDILKNEIVIKMQNGEEVLWFNDKLNNELSKEITKSDIEDAKQRLLRFAPYIKRAFPHVTDGIIESPLKPIQNMRQFLKDESNTNVKGRLLLKCDCNLPISGSIKARGGIYEVLCFAEDVALKSGMLKTNDDYSVLANNDFKKLFSKYSLSVGSTGNLGLSIGIMSAKLGFNVTVHMSSDAKKWKKDMLRDVGANVIEYDGDYEAAVAEGRKIAEKDEMCHFVDDENSKTLFLGYSVAAERLQKQLQDMDIKVDSEHPLFVYLPCGVGGGPGGVAYGLKQIYGEDVHCFFAEPTEAPCMLLGVMTGLKNKISALDIGLTGKTTADGLAVSRCSKLVCDTVGNMLDGLYTVCDDKMEKFLIDLYEKENIFIEPSAAAGFAGFYLTQQNAEYMAKIGESKMENSSHIVWATGGGMVPEKEKETYLKIGV